MIFAFLTVTACGGLSSKDREPMGENTTVELVPPELDDGFNPVLIDDVSYGPQRFRFLKIYDEFGGSDDFTIIVHGQGKMGEGDVYGALQNRATYALTPAEVWLNVSGREDAVPHDLWVDHQRRALEADRPVELQRVAIPELQVSKAATVNWSVLLPFFPSRCWAQVRAGRFPTSLPISNITRFCTEVFGSQPRGFYGIGTPVSASNACPTSFNVWGWIRLSAFNDGEGVPPQHQQFCYGPSSHGSWACFPGSFDFDPGDYVWLDWDSPANKRLGFGVENAPQSAPGFYDYGVTAWLSANPGNPNGLCPGSQHFFTDPGSAPMTPAQP